MDEKEILDLAYSTKDSASVFVDALSQYTINSDKDFEKIINKCRGHEVLIKIDALINSYTPARISSKTFYKIFGLLALKVEDMASFSTGGIEHMLERNKKYEANIICWRSVIHKLLTTVQDFTYEQNVNRTIDGHQIKFNQDLLSLSIIVEDAAFMEYFIQHGVPVDRIYNESNIFGGTLLHILATRENPSAKIAELLIKNGVNVNRQDSKRNIALHYLAINKGWRRVEKLLGYTENNLLNVVKVVTAGINLFETDARLLIDCIREGNTVIAGYFIDNGMNVNAVDEYGWTPLKMAVKNGFAALADKLIAIGAKA